MFRLNFSMPGWAPVGAAALAEMAAGGGLSGMGAVGGMAGTSALASAAPLAAVAAPAAGGFGSALTLSNLWEGAKAFGTLAGGAGAINTMMQKKPGATQLPTLQSPATMPVPDDQAAAAARRRQLAEISQRSGRASTLLTGENQNDRLG